MSLKKIIIEGNEIEPTLHGPGHALPDGVAKDASGTNYVLIQSDGSLTTDQKKDLQSCGVNVQKYISDQTYLCEYRPTDLESLRAKDFVLYANTYPINLKVNSGLKKSEPVLASAVESSASEPIEINVLFHDGINASSDDIKAKIAEKAHVDLTTLESTRRKISLKIERQYIDDLATVDEVRSIEEARKRVLYNNIARGIINADVNINNTIYQGRGQIIAVADTGFDKGKTTGDVHPAFTGRVSRLYPWGKDDAADPEYEDRAGNHHGGHGTHVCGSALGDGEALKLAVKVQGTAPQATLVLQALADAQGNLRVPADLETLFDEPYVKDGARIHTNSWGLPYQFAQTQYDQSAEDIDTYVWNHKDMVICFAAGNDGQDLNGDGVIDAKQVGSESVAKNCITVGASENRRLSNRNIYADFDGTGRKFPADPIKDDLIADNPEGMAAFSSRGPSAEGRFKPDVTAPGTAILSARAHTLSSNIPNSGDPDWFFLSGTSMATPLVAGCVAVLRETLVNNGLSNPPAALLKALLINGAVDMQGQYQQRDVGPSPNNIDGWGRVDLAGSVIIPGPDKPNSGLGTGGPLEEGGEESFVVSIPEKFDAPKVPHSGPRKMGNGDQAVLAHGKQENSNADSGVKFKITLVWSDPPGPLLQNNLNLIVKAANGEERHGNMGIGKGFDTTNNVEQVSWPDMPPGDATVTVRCADLTVLSQPQDYAYAWRISQL